MNVAIKQLSTCFQRLARDKLANLLWHAEQNTPVSNSLSHWVKDGAY